MTYPIFGATEQRKQLTKAVCLPHEQENCKCSSNIMHAIIDFWSYLHVLEQSIIIRLINPSIFLYYRAACYEHTPLGRHSLFLVLATGIYDGTGRYLSLRFADFSIMLTFFTLTVEICRKKISTIHRSSRLGDQPFLFRSQHSPSSLGSVMLAPFSLPPVLRIG